MRILHLTPYYAPAYAFGGVVRSVEGMAAALARRGHDVTVLTTDALDHRRRYAGAQDEMIDGVRVLRRPNVLPRLRGRFNLSTPRSLKRSAEALLPTIDALHIHEFRTLENLLATPVAKKLDVPIVLSPHGTLNLNTGRGALKRAWDHLLSPGIASRIDHVVTLSAAEQDEAETLWRRFGARRKPTGFSVIPNGVDLGDFDRRALAAPFRRRFNLGDGQIALFMGRLHRRKGVDVLIKAFKAIDLEDSRLLIVGPDDGMLSILKAFAEGDRRIIFTGYLQGAERLGALAAADVFALPATGEGQPMAALEAMAAGLPVALSPGCNLDEVARIGAGYVVKAEVDTFAEKLRLLLNDRDLRRTMGLRARQLVQESYTWDEISERLEDVYRSLL
ncbi:MAG: glycosyltransferase [Chloroflexota bacterium]|nr:glycosyltransferase [Chloroflexota bacterium]MDE2908842.1 glycosyltransferase [Chloroflexota bacterium]